MENNMKETLEEAAKKYADTKEEYVLKWRIRKESIAHLGLYLGYIEGAK
jgi:diketogulonate reductase-like aldo/keto reductase